MCFAKRMMRKFITAAFETTHKGCFFFYCA